MIFVPGVAHEPAGIGTWAGCNRLAHPYNLQITLHSWKNFETSHFVLFFLRLNLLSAFALGGNNLLRNAPKLPIAEG